MSKNNQKNYDPNYFLASLGNGGLVVTFFMYLMFMIKHPETPMPTFEDILPVITGTNLVAKISTILVLLGIAYFVFNNIYYLIWNIKKYMNFRLSPEFTKLKSSNAEVTLMSIPLALAMNVNALIVAAVVFVPNLWSYVEYMFPVAIVLFSLIGIYGIKIFAEYFSRIIVEGDFDFDKNNNLSQMIAVFSFIMIGAGFSGPAAMSRIKVVSSISLLLTIFFTSIALAILFIKLVIGFKSILEKGISKEGAPSFFVIIPILTIFGIILVRVTSGVFHTFLHSSPNPIIMFLMLGTLVSIQIIVAFI
nr:hypothetical protein [Rickettsiaceae bacterium]